MRVLGKLTELSFIRQYLAVFLLTVLLLGGLEAMQRVLLRDLGPWASHAITIIFSGLVVVGIFFSVLKVNARRNQMLSAEIQIRKQSEKLLRESEKEFRQLIEYSPVAMALNDKNGRIVYLNNKFVKTFGYTLEDIPDLDSWWPRAYPDEAYRREAMDLWNRAVQNAIKKGEEIEPVPYNVTCKDGTVRVVEILGANMGEKNLVIFDDITEQKKAESEREKLIAELRDAFAKVRLLGGLLPICASCKRIRDDKGYWKQIEEYIRSHSEADFTHGICPECMQKLYRPDQKES
ncbi:MAG: PAS domain S-box protein [Nitrospiraceae bacterium]|nr:MAG: PAS domain S-box protein [Nitrospiraceae bacterium]